jgi:hypothetical protein
MLGRGLAKSPKIFLEHLVVQSDRTFVRGAQWERDPHLHVPARQAALDQRSHGVLKEIGGGRSVHMHIQRAMIQRLHTDHHLAVA